MKFDVVIIGGLGHVGLPLGISLAFKNLKVLLFDIDREKTKTVRKGIMPFIEYGAENLLKKTLKNKKLSISNNLTDVSNAKHVIITIGTPIDEYLNPQVNSFIKFYNKLNKYLTKTQNIIIRSSVFPGTCKMLDEKFSNKMGYTISYCPERIVQGYSIQELRTLPQIVGSNDPKAIKKSSELFKKLTKKIISCNFEEAELSKLFNNSSRYIEFSISNQFFMISSQFDADFNKIRKIMAYGYKRGKLLPSPGFSAGPCLLKDTMQLYAAANQQYLIGFSAMNINEGLPNFIVNKISKKISLKNKTVGILGMAFKANVDDIRDSLSFKLKKILEFNGSKVLFTDPFVKHKDNIPINLIFKKCKIVIIATPHDKYKNITFDNKIKVIDIWGITKNNFI